MNVAYRYWTRIRRLHLPASFVLFCIFEMVFCEVGQSSLELVICLPQSPQLLGLQVCFTMPNLSGSFKQFYCANLSSFFIHYSFL
jgi:hypothetical protein